MRSFSKKATTSNFKKRLRFANIVKQQWPLVKLFNKSAYWYRAIHQDPNRAIQIEVYTSIKVKGAGAGRPNEIVLKFNQLDAPVSAGDLKVYYKEYNIK